LDITDQINRENKIQEVQHKLETLMSNLPGIAYRCKNDAKWTMEFMSDGTYELTGYFPEDLIQNTTCSYADLIHDDDKEMVWENTQHALWLKQNFKYTYRIKTASNEEKWVFEQGKGLFDEEGSLQAIEGFITDISTQKQTEFRLNKALEELALAHELLQLKSERLEHLAIHDPLTGLYNRRELDAAIEQEYASLQRLQQPFAVLILDIDHFKNVNDSWGHPVGDQVLIGLANLLKQDLRLNDRLIRYGGEEFAIVLSSLKKTDAHLLAERIRTRIARTPIKVSVSKNQTMDLTIHVSIGLACATTGDNDPQQLIKLADDALYAAKRSGRNKTIVAE
jgi:diguanylate cyclase (GGDEF)-like protein